ncbi:hypothetical protein CASFOL_012297 [Castilleja foliolosa]|uniref:Uncharacterized protein n=1 Tax=Castilleja foliolosa TaxID=1961234 RepID=A0ABD3DU26_9LAMI
MALLIDRRAVFVQDQHVCWGTNVEKEASKGGLKRNNC